MATIERIAIDYVDLAPKVVRTDAIQSFVSQQTPIVTITDSDGASGTGYTYTIGTGGTAIVRLLADNLLPFLKGRDASLVEANWKALKLHTHATTPGAITALALAAIDTALWDLSCRKAGLPLHVMAGGAQERVPLYTTEGGWLHISPEALAEDAARARAEGFGGSKIKIGKSDPREDVRRLETVREAVGDGFEILTDANQAFRIDEAIRRARLLEPLDIGWLEEPLVSDDIEGHRRLCASTTLPVAVGESIYSEKWFREYMARGACSIDPGRRGADRRDHAVAQGRPCGGGVQHARVSALSDGASRGGVLCRAERAMGRVYPPARFHHDDGHDHQGRSRRAIGHTGQRHCVGFRGHRTAACPRPDRDLRETVDAAHGYGDRHRARTHRRIQAPPR